MITLDPKARCLHGQQPERCGYCLSEWAEHMERERDAARARAYVLPERNIIPASDRERQAFLDSVAPRTS